MDNREEGDRDLVFYYSREHRLSRASPEVRELNDGVIKRPGLFRSLTSTRGHLFLLLSIFVICGMIFIVFYSPEERALTLGGNKLTLSIQEGEEGGVLTIVKEAPRGKASYTGAVDLAVSPAPAAKGGSAAGGEAGGSSEPEILTRRIFFTLEETESYRIPLSTETGASLNGEGYYVMLQSENERISRKITLP
ncbi:MAG: hypothetical protein LBL43_07810 [Treponema sp.]|jgi:hypothetical protein|nr:hypothetical protein [Treponema sp.]